MDINILRAAVTVFSLLVFLCIVAWAYSSRNKSSFDEQAMLPLGDDVIGRAQ
ncbi:cbb3-type cytochrome oxidase subunit 3 [Roseateles oligotrophus]|uniref:CcoQ/FixQ family Cbb3-type cytochrome c oxidase assembly chaperone n=1 Tax=Roseateles oligotrophus TaxID=1769250 RepID=A0ABT2YGW9_9BURK|nr:CcoQ/FixQ family Cbb3-type cytochrome c oxidase assembly chaperone [Roseateles oligotrophus]MCV2369304.1 CcoQ/FixQ family Cbb3-type cytochrome c oxidase assembly chaperone [Roseateles oligotrophus]